MTKEELDAMRLKANEQISEPEADKPEGEPAEEPKEDGEAPVEAEKPDAKPEAEAEEEAEEPTVEKDPPRVPYSRFETVNEARIIAEQKVKLFEETQERERLEKAAAKGPEGLPAYWVKLYGDSEASKEAYALRQQELTEIRQSLQSSIREDMVKEQVQQEQRTDTLVDEWSSQIDDFASENKRKFTDADTDALLDVMDELTPKDGDGNYIVEPIQYLARAVELYDLRQEKALAAKKISKQQTTKLTAAKSEGIPANAPGEWDGDWRKKLAKMGQ